MCPLPPAAQKRNYILASSTVRTLGTATKDAKKDASIPLLIELATNPIPNAILVRNLGHANATSDTRPSANPPPHSPPQPRRTPDPVPTIPTHLSIQTNNPQPPKPCSATINPAIESLSPLPQFNIRVQKSNSPTCKPQKPPQQLQLRFQQPPRKRNCDHWRVGSSHPTTFLSSARDYIDRGEGEKNCSVMEK